MRLHIDTRAYSDKPKDKIQAIKPRIQNEYTITDVSIHELAERIGQGYTVSPGVLVGGAKTENWTEQQVFMVDIDNDADENLAKRLKVSVDDLTDDQRTPIMPVAESLDICRQKNLRPAFYYHSFSHLEQKPKFRLCFVFDEPVTEPGTREVIVTTLISLFNQADTSCRNADRVFFGTDKQVVILDAAATISLEQILEAYTPPPQPERQQSQQTSQSGHDLARLKQEYDFFGFLKARNGEVYKSNHVYSMFRHCELCGHEKDLVFYHQTNMFRCFGAGCNRGGSIIDYIALAENISAKDAISRFLYELCGLEKQEFSQAQKRDYAINNRVQIDLSLHEKLSRMQPDKTYSFDDKGFGQLFADVYKDIARYNVTAKSWYCFSGKVWAEDTGGMRVSQLAKELANALLVYSTTIPDDYQKDVYQKYVYGFGQYRNRETMVKDARDCYFFSQADLDRNLDLFNCQNGTLNLATFEFYPHRPSDLLSKISNVVYNPTASSELFENFVREVMVGDVEKIEYLQKILGYSLTADTSLETCFILYGATTRNGKSTLVETFNFMLGNAAGYAMTMKPETLAAKQNKDSRQASGDIARLNGCRFLNASEPPKRMLFDVALLKTLLGRDSITARHLYEREFEFIPHFKMMINTNFLPLVQDDTLFSSGRINVISFDRHFEPHEQDKTLKNRLQRQENISGLFNWCLQGLIRFRQSGAEPPPSVKNATAEYRQSSDKVGNFIAERLVQSPRSNTKAGDVYQNYQMWCTLNGFGVENQSNFFDELKAKNIFKNHGTVNGVTARNVVIGYAIAQT